MKKMIHKRLFKDVLQESLFWKFLERHTQFIQNATLDLWEKNDSGCLTSFYKKKNPRIFPGFPKDAFNEIEFYRNEFYTKSNKNQSILCNNSSVITSHIKLTNLTMEL